MNDFNSLPRDSRLSDILALAGQKAGATIEGPGGNNSKWTFTVMDDTSEVTVEVDTSTGGSIQII